MENMHFWKIGDDLSDQVSPQIWKAWKLERLSRMPDVQAKYPNTWSIGHEVCSLYQPQKPVVVI